MEALSIARIGTWELDFETGRQWWSSSTHQVLGVSKDFEPTNANVLARIHPDDREAVEAEVARYTALGQDNEMEYRVISDDGSVRRVFVTARFRKGADGVPIGVFGVMQDITARAALESELRQALEELSVAQHVGKIGSWSLEADTGEVRWSDEMVRLMGVDASTAGDPKDFPNIVHPDDRARITQNIERVIPARLDSTDEFRIVLPDGEVRWIRCTGRWHDGPAGRRSRMLGTNQDITAEREAAQARLDLASKMEHAQKLESLGVLAGGIAHDFNNLLVGILGNASLALDDLPESSETRELLEDISDAADRAADLAGQMLAYSGHGKFVVERSDLGLIVKDMSHLLEASVSKNARLRRDFAPNLPAVEVDRTQIGQVVMNLITNASDALGEEQGVILVRTGARWMEKDDLRSTYLDDDLEAGLFSFVEVSDTGEGMSQEVLARLFDPFYTTRFTGRGLGLAAVLGIVRSHRGAIALSSEVGSGTTFTVFLPAVDGPVEEGLAGMGSSPGWEGRGRVLLVDDESSVLRVGSRWTTSPPCSVSDRGSWRSSGSRSQPPRMVRRVWRSFERIRRTGSARCST